MRRTFPAPRLTRALLAFACALSLALGLIGHAEARAAKAFAPPPQPAAVSTVAAQPCPAAAVCSFAGISAALTAEEAAFAPASGAASRALRHAFRDEAAPASPAGDAPFRPPRTV